MDATREEAAEEPQVAPWSLAAAFCDDIRLADAKLGRPWQLPEKGPVPVVEILRDGR